MVLVESAVSVDANSNGLRGGHSGSARKQPRHLDERLLEEPSGLIPCIPPIWLRGILEMREEGKGREKETEREGEGGGVSRLRKNESCGITR